MIGLSGFLWPSLHIMTKLRHPPTILHFTLIMDSIPGKGEVHVTRDRFRQPRTLQIRCEGYGLKLRQHYKRRHRTWKWCTIVDIPHCKTIKLVTKSGWRQPISNLTIQLRNSTTNGTVPLLSLATMASQPTNSNYLRLGDLCIQFSMNASSHHTGFLSTMGPSWVPCSMEGFSPRGTRMEDDRWAQSCKGGCCRFSSSSPRISLSHAHHKTLFLLSWKLHSPISNSPLSVQLGRWHIRTRRTSMQ